MPLFLVTIHDKDLRDEVDIAIGVVEATDQSRAILFAKELVNDLAEAGRGRCVPRAREVGLGAFYRIGQIVRLPRVEG